MHRSLLMLLCMCSALASSCNQLDTLSNQTPSPSAVVGGTSTETSASPPSTDSTELSVANGQECLNVPARIRDFDVSSDGKKLVIAGEAGYALVDLTNLDNVSLGPVGGNIGLIQFAPKGDLLAGVNEDYDTLQIWDPNTAGITQQLSERRADDVSVLGWSSEGDHIAVAGKNGDVVIWDTNSGEVKGVFEEYERAKSKRTTSLRTLSLDT